MLSKYIFYLKNDKILMFKYKNYNIETHRHVHLYIAEFKLQMIENFLMFLR